MSIFFEILVRMASYGPQINQSHGENRLSHIIRRIMEIDLRGCYPPRPMASTDNIIPHKILSLIHYLLNNRIPAHQPLREFEMNWLIDSQPCDWTHFDSSSTLF